jgi:acetyl-CoA synthetase
MDLAIIDPTSGEVLEGNDVEGVLVAKAHWPSIARTVYKDDPGLVEMAPGRGVTTCEPVSVIQ